VSTLELFPTGPAAGITAAYRRAAAGRMRDSMRWLRQHLILTLAVPAAAAMVVAVSAYYWSYARFIVSTNDAYVQADSTLVAPRVSGYVAQVLVEDHQTVKSGQVLARLDERDFRAAWDQTRADVQASEAEIGDLQAQLAEQHAINARARASVAASQAALDLANINRDRYRKMAGIGFGSQQQSQEADAHARERTADLARDRAALSSAEGQVRVLQAKIVQAQALIERSQAIERRAALELGYTTIVAPIDGVVAARTIRVGQYAQAGTQLMALVPLHDVYVTANFKETQLTHVHAGEPVRLRVDTFPGVHLQACVESLAPASGLEFSLLPPDNATGNFTKIVQRIPVRIRLDSHDPLIGRLRPGMSVEASIDTRPAARSAMAAGCELAFAETR
jgi:membrane fusion protein (multidrug efflux system)